MFFGFIFAMVVSAGIIFGVKTLDENSLEKAELRKQQIERVQERGHGE